MSVSRPVAIFWDLENCPVPNNKSAFHVCQEIRKCCENLGSEVDFTVVCDVTKQKKDLVTELNLAQVTVVHVYSTSKNAADEKICHCLRKFTSAYQSPGTIVLISSDVNFAPELKESRYRLGFDVVLIYQPKAVSTALLALANIHYSYLHFITRVTVPSITKTASDSVNYLLEIFNLPGQMPQGRVHGRLAQMSDNCGGKVYRIDMRTCQAWLKFASKQSAQKAKTRLHMENVFNFFIRTGRISKIKSKFHAHSPDSDDSDCGLQFESSQSDGAGDAAPSTSARSEAQQLPSWYYDLQLEHLQLGRVDETEDSAIASSSPPRKLDHLSTAVQVSSVNSRSHNLDLLPATVEQQLPVNTPLRMDRVSRVERVLTLFIDNPSRVYMFLDFLVAYRSCFGPACHDNDNFTVEILREDFSDAVIVGGDASPTVRLAPLQEFALNIRFLLLNKTKHQHLELRSLESMYSQYYGPINLSHLNCSTVSEAIYQCLHVLYVRGNNRNPSICLNHNFACQSISRTNSIPSAQPSITQSFDAIMPNPSPISNQSPRRPRAKRIAANFQV